MNLTYPDIQDGETVVLDTETNGLDWQTCHTVGFVVTRILDGRIFSNEYYPIRHETGPNLDPNRVIAWIKSWAGRRIHIIGHNIKFDLHMFANDGIFFPNATFEDTQVNATLINEHLGSFSLDNLGKEYKVTAKKGTALYEYLASKFGGEPTKNQMSNYWRLPADDKMGVDYALGDGVTTFEAWKVQSEIIPYQELQRVHKVECALTPVLFKMERRGVPVSQDSLDKLKVYVDRRLVAARALLPKDFKPRSAKQVANVLSEQDGLSEHDFPRTALGNLSFTEDFLKGYPSGRAIINSRKLENLQDTFIKGAVEDKIYRGRIHCSFNQMFDGEYGTHTGRLSSSQPNMQQVPKRDKLLAPIFRRIFVPEQGCVWDTNDYSQQEYRVFATYSNSATLIDNYRNGVDMHQTIADLIQRERDPWGKRMNLAMLYWMGKDKLARSLGISVEEAISITGIYHDKVPEVKQFLHRCQARGRQQGFVKTILGRRARFPDPSKSYKGASRVIQGTCADIVKAKMVEVNNYLEDETRGEHGLILQVHDSLDWFLPQELRRVTDEAIKVMADMSTVDEKLHGKVPMKVDHASGESWGHASFPYQDWSVYDEEVSGSELSDEVED